MIAVVNLTLIDLPGLTKVAVGEFVIFIILHSFVLATVSSMETSFQLNKMFVWLFFVDGQPDSIVMDIENMVRSYIEKVLYSLFHC